ncbi:MAG: Tellurite resistance protein TerB, partial [Sphingobacteriales bacterium]
EKLINFARLIEAHGVGMEPDVLSGVKLPKNNEFIILFAKPIGDDSVTPAYHAACVTLDLAAAVALADGHASECELNMLNHQIVSWVHLSEGQRQRLKARLALQIQQPITLESVKKNLEPISQSARRSIGHLLAQLVQVDGVITKEEVKLLERIYKALQLDSQLVYSDLHTSPQNITSVNNLGTLAEKKKSGSGFVLDPDRIAALQRETDQVSALLANVFTEDISVEEPAEITVMLESSEENVESMKNILGLDKDHSAFLRFLVTRSTWTRDELVDVASDFELMLDGALEQINEAALDHLDDQLIEGDGPVEINQNLVERISL